MKSFRGILECGGKRSATPLLCPRRAVSPSGCHRTPKQRKAGFSLLEVLVALAVFGIATGGMLVALGHHLKSVAFMQDHARAVRIAGREMNALRRSASLDEEEISGSEDRFSWTAQVHTDGLDDWPGLEAASGTPVLLAVTVQWSDGGSGPVAGKVHLDGFAVF